MSRDTFSTYNPIICFTFYIGAFVFGVFFVHPVFLLCSLIMSSAYYLSIKGSEGFKLILGIIPVLILLSVLNPLVNLHGETVLFEYFGGRPYTLEALFYGIALGVMFVSVIIWFASYNAVMTSDKFIYIFGRLLPSASLILTMVLRLVPDYLRKVRQIGGARKCIGRGVSSGSKREAAENGLTIISALTSWALEGGIITADSMRSRGYGSAKRTSFSVYRFAVRDRVLFALMVILAAFVILASVQGGTAAQYVPRVSFAWFGNPWTVFGGIVYFIFLAIPTVLNIAEVIRWRILRSKI